MTEANNRSPIFVVGCPRSGTHLMRYCLSQHPNIYIGPETGFFMSVYGNRRLVPEWRLKHCFWKLVNRMFACSGDPSMGEFKEGRDAICAKGEGCQTYRDLAVAILGSFAARKGKSRWGEKTPHHAMFLKEIFRLFPEARVINMHRNPKAVAASYLKCGHMPANLYKAIADYRNCVTAVKPYESRILTVEYESLVQNSEMMLRSVCDFLEEDYCEEMLNPKMRDSAYRKPIMEFDKNIRIETDSLERWREILTEEEQHIVDVFTKTGQQTRVFKYARAWLEVKRFELRFRMRIEMARKGFEALRSPNIWLK